MPRQIVRYKRKGAGYYGARQIQRYVGLRYPRLSTAAAFLYNNRKAIGTGIDVGRTAWSYLPKRRSKAKKAVRQKKAKVGHPVRSSNTKQSIITDVKDGGINTRNLYYFDMLTIPQSTSNERRDERVRDIINFRGWKLCFQIRNELTSPVWFHWAILQPKRPAEFGLERNTAFFRSPGTENRAVDFGNGLTALELDCNSINTDLFNVIHHKRFQLGPREGNTEYTQGTSRNWYTLNRYIPLKRQIRYGSSGTPESALFFVYWCDKYGALAGSPDEDGACTWQFKMVAYFHETASF